VTPQALTTIAHRLLRLAMLRATAGDFTRAADAARTAARLLGQASKGGL